MGFAQHRKQLTDSTGKANKVAIPPRWLTDEEIEGAIANEAKLLKKLDPYAERLSALARQFEAAAEYNNTHSGELYIEYDEEEDFVAFEQGVAGIRKLVRASSRSEVRKRTAGPFHLYFK